MKVTFKPDWAGVRSLSQTTGPVGRAVLNAARTTQKRAQSMSPVDTGRLRSSVDLGRTRITDQSVSIEVTASAPYAAPVNRRRPFMTDALRQLSSSDFRE